MGIDLLGEFRLGEWSVYPERNCIASDGKETHLESKVMAVLVYLSGKPEQVVSKVELLEYNPLWHDKAESLGQEVTYSRRTFLTQDEKDLARRCFEGFDMGKFG